MHVPSSGPGLLPSILGRAGPLPTAREMASRVREQVALGSRIAAGSEARGDRSFADFVRRHAERLERRAQVLDQLLREPEADDPGRGP